MANRDNPDFLSASTLKGDKVVNAAGEDIGKIEELMIDLRDGRLAYVVMSFGGFLGLGDKLFAIPWQAFRLKLHDHAFILDVPKDVLEKAEGFDKDNWPITSREWVSTLYSYYGYQPYWQPRVPEEVESQRMARTRGTSSERENPDFLSADTLKGDKVVDKSGKDIGKIEEFMIDLQDGKVGYVVVSHGGFLGLGNKLFAIPWDALSLRLHEHAFALNVSNETFDKAEGFDKDNWPLTREELSRTYSYYGYQPYWQTGVATQAAGVSAAMPVEGEPERMARMEREGQVPLVGAEERKTQQERERLEELRRTQEEKISQLEKQQMKAQKQAEAERERLVRLEKERIEAERQAQAEKQRLAQLEKELQEARRQEKMEAVARLEEELRSVQIQEGTRRDRLAQLEKECTEAQRQAETERQRLAQLERERTEVESQAETERQRLAQLERERTEAETLAQTRVMAGREMPDFLSASTIKTDRVVNAAGEDLGRIEELMIDLENGKIAYAVLSFGGFLGMADKFFAIPWQAFTLRPHEHAFLLDIPRDVLEKAEGFDKDNWPLTREELSRTYTYYGYQPYWQTGVATGMPRETQPQRTTRTQSERPLGTAEELIARQEKERIEKLEKTETDEGKLEQLERDKEIAERRERKYH
ncbi:PRC-barrel domain-containing protein [Methanosarcina sp.]|uniref:PRC-barrel domain-containing protein n=1 Tax=Methanosarcina sp. TaxID=2213 RepID=UPI0029894AB1|nr:PRC-barrel domain-containing protein [Methanosarcina sp.]MDW5549508.1 PRC-barrel domain-containing protein [Methanosarcina sp.]MDW5553542.1 PRC-barrel domain-containing protein [Methanosarcina sp.]MDW5558654.1 PRC-barrel domain-containing protein [Methanosarcina sp.]